MVTQLLVTQKFALWPIAVRLLEPEHLEEDYPITIFLKTKDSQDVFCKWTNKIQGSTMQPLKILKPFELTYNLSGNSPQIHVCYRSVCEKT